MKHTSLFALTALCLAASSVAQSSVAQSSAPNWIGEPSSWSTVLDGVMGGRSTGRVGATEDGAIAFSGKLSLENNGGFSQMRRPIKGRGLAGAKGLALEVRGDGRTYKFDIRVSNARMMAGGFQLDFETVAGKWTKVRLPFEDFRLYSFGRLVRSAPVLDASLIESIGVTLADKNAGDFRLEVRSIKTLADAGDQVGNDQVGNGGDAGAGNDLVSVAKAAGLTTLLDLVGAAKLELPKTPVTIFAPTNEAFAALPQQTLKQLLKPESRDTLRQILGFHIVPGVRSSDSVLNARSLPSLAGQPLAVDAAAGRIAGAGIVAVDVPFEGGVVHVIDKVMLPEQRSVAQVAASDSRLSTLMTAVSSANLAAEFERQDGVWTIFAPVDSAFAKLPKGTVESLLKPENVGTLRQILGLHVVRGRIAARELLAKKDAKTLLGQSIGFGLKDGKLTVGDNAQIVAADIQAQNGVIHLIDSVLLPKTEAAVAKASKATRNTAGDGVEDFVRIYAMAVDRGAPLFNDGNPDACAAVYEVAIETMIAFGGGRLGDEVLKRLVRARDEASAMSGRDRAWAFRLALDDSLGMLRSNIRQRESLPVPRNR